MSKNNLFKIPFGFYVENNKLISKRTQIEELLDSINANAESNSQLDEEQQKQIDANKGAIDKEIERSTNLDEQFVKDLEIEVSERKRMGSILNDKINNLDESLKSLVEETDNAFDIVASELKKKDEMLDAKDDELSNSISFLRASLDSEIATRKNSDENLSDAIKINLDHIEDVESTLNELATRLEKEVAALNDANMMVQQSIIDEASAREERDSELNAKINVEKAERLTSDSEINEKLGKIVLSVKEVYNYAKSNDELLANTIASETERAIEAESKKIEWTDLGNDRKAIILDNHDLLLGKDTNGGVYNIGMVSKWNTVDLGTSSLPINLNTPSGVRPTVQEAGQSGEEAHKIAYLSDLEVISKDLVNVVKEEENRAKSAESLLENKIDSSVISLNSSINNVNSTLGILSATDTALNSRVDLMTTSFNQFKANGIELVAISDLQYTLYVDGVNKGLINIPKDNFLSNVYLTEGDKLHFVFNVGESQNDIEVDIAKYIDVYTAGEGLSVSDNKFSIVIDADSEGYLSVSENGLSLKGVNNMIKTVVTVEEERAKEAEKELDEKIREEVVRIENNCLVLEESISLEKRRAVEAEQYLSDRLSIVEAFETSILDNKKNINSLSDKITLEEVRATNVESVLSNEIAKLNTNISANESSIKILETSIENETLMREMQGNDILEKMETVSADLFTEIERAKSAERINAAAISEERNRAIEIENKKVDWTDLGNDRKAIILGNHDLLLGTNSDKTKTYNIAMISKWDSVDLGTSSLPINLNTPSGIRPTVQEAGQSGEEANKIAYLSDFNGYATEEWVDGKGYLTAVPEGYATVDDVTAAVSDKVSETRLNEEIEGIYGKVNSLMNEEFELMKQMIIDLQLKVNELESRVYSSQDLIDKINSLSEDKSLSIKLYSDLVFDKEDKLQIPSNSVLNLDLNGKKIEGNFADILFRVNGTLNIYGDGVIKGESYVASVNEGGIVNVYNGNFLNEVTSFQANGGIINVEGGYFETYSETYGSKYTLNHVDSKKEQGLIKVSGGIFVNYNPEESHGENPPMNFLAEGYGVEKFYIDEKPIYRVVKQQEIKSSEELINMISSLEGNDKTFVKLTKDIILESEEKLIVNGNLDLRLNGYTIKLTNDDILFRVNGKLTIGGGRVISEGYVGSANEGGSITVLDGEYEGSVTCFQSNGGELIIEGGHFSSCNDTYGCKYTLNYIDSMKNIGNIVVKGGTFVGYNPAESESENPVMSFLAEGYKSVEIIEDGLTVYTVIKE